MSTLVEHCTFNCEISCGDVALVKLEIMLLLSASFSILRIFLGWKKNLFLLTSGMLRSWPDWSGWGTTTGIKLSLPPIGAKAEFTGGGPGVSAPGSKKLFYTSFSMIWPQMTFKWL